MLEDGTTVSLVMPARNEGNVIPKLLETVSSRFDEIIIVSNRSVDDTVEVTKTMAESDKRVKVYVDDRALHGIGAGYAVRSACSAATCDYIVTCDCDGTYPFNDAVMDGGIIERMQDKDLVFVTGSRYPDKTIRKLLQLGVKVLNVEMRLLYRMPVTDSLSGMFVMTREAWDALKPVITMGDWNYSPQMKIEAYSVFGDKYAEMKIIQGSRIANMTKQQYWKTGFNHLFWIFLHRLGKA